MGISCENDTVRFDGVVYEDTVSELRDYLQVRAPEAVRFDFSGCEDMHLAVVQVVLAYARLYPCDYRFAEASSAYRKVIEGFDPNEDHCSQ